MPASVAHSFSDAVTLIRQGFETLTATLTPDLSATDFHALEGSITQLTETLTAHSVITITIAYLADKHHSGDRVGSRTADTYIAKLLGISLFEAGRLVQRGKDTFATPRLVDIHRDLNTLYASDDVTGLVGEEDESVEQRTARFEKKRSRFFEAQHIHETEKEAQRNAVEAFRKNTINEEHLRVLDRELNRLNTNLNRHNIRARALFKASDLSIKDFRNFVRRLIDNVNAQHHDPQAAYKRRFLTIGVPDADGGAKLTGYIPATTLALIQEALSSTNQPDKCATNEQQPRTLQQRRVDELTHILCNNAAHISQNRGGIGTIVVSMTSQELRDILDENNAARLSELVNQPRPTNTAAMLSLLDLYNMELATYDMACLHNPETGNPLFCGRAKRSATLTQKIALIATELVCSYPDCDVPACNCEVHHMTAWKHNGTTDIDNLTLRCRNHHMDNNDSHDPAIRRGWAERDPYTGRVGHQPPPAPDSRKLEPISINIGYKAQQSAGWKLREQNQQGDKPKDCGVFGGSDAHITSSIFTQNRPIITSGKYALGTSVPQASKPRQNHTTVEPQNSGSTRRQNSRRVKPRKEAARWVGGP